ncbi:MAG: ATP-grasp fold amidoligase family protein [Collinsella sp.]
MFENVIARRFLDEMMRLSSVLARDFPMFARRLVQADGHPYFGELTFYTGGGFDPFYGDARHPDALDCRLGESSKLPQVQGAEHE